MDCNRILLVLSAKPEGGSALYVNGIESQPGSIEMHTITELSYLAGKHRSPWCGIINDCFFIKGFFNNKDNHGNKMTFSYCANINSIEVGKKIFFGDIVPLGYKIDDETSESLESRLKKTLLRYIGFAALVIIFLIILLIVIK